MSLVQKIVKQAAATFAGSGFDSAAFEKLSTLMNELKPTDVNMTSDPESVLAKPSERAAPAGYMEILDDSNFTCVIFMLRKGRAIPLHDHPGMHGLCKVLYGSVKITSYDPPEKLNLSKSGFFKAKYRGAETFSADNGCHFVLPTEKNLHTIEGLTNTAFFDILAPPYESYGARGCTYYTEIPKDVVDEELIARGYQDMIESDDIKLLRRSGQPGWFYTSVEDYKGPPVEL
ncbi:2-aminoethanethiol dioxygenase-like [Oscarella lobularis]|uniref:2-aminoethanethiol dioxygenase-like n=1 Tax=Oscarella lobularis TaxID=121494 RepID=UPI003313BD56